MAAPEHAWNISYNFSVHVHLLLLFFFCLIFVLHSLVKFLWCYVIRYALINAIQIVQMNAVLLLEITGQSLINAQSTGILQRHIFPIEM